MIYTNTTDKRFLSTLEEWLRTRAEVLTLIRLSRAAGNKSFEFLTSFIALEERLNQLTPETCVTAFGRPQLPIRGVVDDEFIRSCLLQIQNGSEFLSVETVPRNAGNASWYHHEAGTSHSELREALENSKGMPVAVGEYPPWLEESPDVISGYVPDATGKLTIGLY
jgi:hypothetical protein